MGRYGKRADLIVHEQEPFNAESGLAALAEGPLTATDAFYVRGPRRGAGDRSWRVVPAGARARRATAEPFARHACARRCRSAR